MVQMLIIAIILKNTQMPTESFFVMYGTHCGRFYNTSERKDLRDQLVQPSHFILISVGFREAQRLYRGNSTNIQWLGQNGDPVFPVSCQWSLCKCFLTKFPASSHAHNRTILHTAARMIFHKYKSDQLIPLLKSL